MSTKEIQEQLVDNMKRWQRIENGAVASTGAPATVTFVVVKPPSHRFGNRCR